MKPITTLIVISNDRHARLLEARGIGKGVVEITTLDADAFADTDVEYADRLGHSQAAPGMATHSVERPTPEEVQERRAFAEHVVKAVDRAMKKNGYDRLALVAPAKMLGELRKLVDGPLKDKLYFDLAKDLVKAPVDKLPDHLADHIVL